MRWIVILVIVGAIIFFLMNQEDESATKPASSSPPASSMTMTPAPAQAAPQQAAPAPPQPPADPTIRLKQVAAAVGVELRGYEPQPGGALITVAWGGDQATLGGDFLEQCGRQGLIRDFNPNSQGGAAMENGRRVWIAQYAVKF